MWWSDRRGILLSALALGACGFAPAYGPGGSAGRLSGRIGLPEPRSEAAFAFNQRFEERLGRSTDPAFLMAVSLQTDEQGLGSTSAGITTRFRLLGRAFYALSAAGSEAVLLEGRSNAFTGYSATGSTVATLAAERDALRRLMVILADQVVDALILDADLLPA